MLDPLDALEDLQGQVDRLENALAAERAHSRKWEKRAKNHMAKADHLQRLLRSSQVLLKIHELMKETQ